MTTIDVPAGSLALDDTGGDGPTVLLLHGVPGSRGVWREVAPRLAGSGCRVLTPDLLGFGGSSRPATIEAGLGAQGQAAALAAALRALGAGPVTVVGHDYGGPVGITLADAHPDLVNGLALLATNAFPDTPIPFPLSATVWPVVGAVASRALFSRPSLALMLRTGVGRPRVALDAGTYLGDAAQSRAIATLFADALRHLALRYAPVEQALRRVGVPTFVGWGDRDPFFGLPVGKRTADAARCELTTYAGAGHFIPEERPAELTADLLAFATHCDIAPRGTTRS